LMITATSGTQSHTMPVTLTVTPNPNVFTPIRVNAGGSGYTDSLGHFWAPDSGYNGGLTYVINTPIAGTNDQPLFQTERYSNTGTLQYQFAVPNGGYTVNLSFSEWFTTAAGQRVFDVAINGITVYPHLDVFAAAGGPNKAMIQSYPVTV